MTKTLTPATWLQRILGDAPTAQALGELLSDLEGMNADTAAMIYGDAETKAAVQALTFKRYLAARTAR